MKSAVDMRDAFFGRLYEVALDDPHLIVMTSDMGAFGLDKFRKGLRRQYINAGAAEQNMMSVAAGLALGGKRVFVYGIIPFITLRCYEQIKVDLCGMGLPVTIVGVGAGLAYGSDGPTHHATHDLAIMRALSGMTILNPSDPVMAAAAVDIAYRAQGPVYIRIDTEELPAIYEERDNDFSGGLTELRKGKDLVIIATGIMVHHALRVSRELAARSLSAGVVDLYRIKPLSEEALMEIVGRAKRIVTLEENSIIGGIGSAISELLSDRGKAIPLKRIALPDRYHSEPDARSALWERDKLGVAEIAKTIAGGK